MTFKIIRQWIGFLFAFVTIIICVYYISMGQSSTSTFKVIRTFKDSRIYNRNSQFNNYNTGFIETKYENDNEILNNTIELNLNKNCYVLTNQLTNVTTSEEFSKFEFQPEWIKTKEYWDTYFEDRYKIQMQDRNRLPLKIIIVPHSHNDPGWLKTYINYFLSDSRQILNLVINKMTKYTDMTFIWSEISFLQLWWDQAHPTKRRALKRLIQSGRFEITTGGWVMTDEANVHLYAMIDQLIEGHQWTKINLNVTPTVGWSIDPFGHGATIPYLLAASDFEGTIIQRIHYAWKQWLAKHQNGDFIWMPFWKSSLPSKNKIKRSLLTHNMPFDIYSIKHSCGPHPFVCLNFDFRKIFGEYTEYSAKAQFITDENVAEKAQLLIEQYSRTASLLSHNVALIPVGDDFRYNTEEEIDQQYGNYKKLIDYINVNKNIFNTDISFGTPKDYFKEIKKRVKEFPTLKGDFFVYSDIFSDGRPAYWSGYFTTRPFYKMLSNELEHNLRSSEILFTLAYNIARQKKYHNIIKVLEKNYEKIICGRRNLGLFQHHDAITGTSKSVVMRDYGLRLFGSIQDTVKMQESIIEMLLQDGTFHSDFILSELERENFNTIPRKTPFSFNERTEMDFVIFNSLAQKRLEIISIRVNTPELLILNEKGIPVKYQINPVWNIIENYAVPNNKEVLRTLANEFEVLFLAELPALSLLTYKIVKTEDFKKNMAKVYCNYCFDSAPITHDFQIKNKQPGDIQLENNMMRLLFDETSGFLKSVTRKNVGKSMQCAIKFGAYKSAQFHSGAYLFKTDHEQGDIKENILSQYENIIIIITFGTLISDVTVIYGPLLVHTVRIFNTHSNLDDAIYIENHIDFGPAPFNRETELFMRLTTEIENGEIPEFYSDQNGFQFHRRVKQPSIGIEGNYFPITTSAFIEDGTKRVTLLTTHAQGAASLSPGELEVMLDRRTLYDDHRGMGEGIVDSKLTYHKFWMIIEDIPTKTKHNYQVPSLLANHLGNNLRYPPMVYFLEKVDTEISNRLKKKLNFLRNDIPCDMHLMNARTITNNQLPLFPSNSALILLHRQGYDYKIGRNLTICNSNIKILPDLVFDNLVIERIESTSLTGIKKIESIKSFREIDIEAMDIKTFKLIFKL